MLDPKIIPPKKITKSTRAKLFMKEMETLKTAVAAASAEMSKTMEDVLALDLKAGG